MTQTLSKNVIADFETQLAVKMAIGATEGTLVSATDDDSVALPTGKYFLTVNKGSSKKEYLKCTLTGTALTDVQSVSRQGVLTTGCAREHRVGANVIISDFASLSKINDLLSGATDLDSGTPLKYDGTATISNDAHLATKKYVDDNSVGVTGDETIAGVKTFSDSPIVPTPTTDMQVATKKYADDLAIAGSPNASTTVKGIVEEATSAEIIAGTGAGATGARLFVNPTQVATSGASKIVLTKPNGQLDQSLVAPYFVSLMDFDSGTRMINSNFIDSLDTRVARNGTNLFVDSPLAFGLQVRGLTSDWASADGIQGTVTIGAYVYVLLKDASSNYRVYRYALSNLSAGGTLMTISGQAFSTTGGASVKMTSDGTNFWFTYKGGNSANAYVISKYTLSGTTLTYVSDVSCGSTSDHLSQFAVLSTGEFYGIAGADGVLRKYDSAGTLTSTANRGFANKGGLNNYSDTLYVETDVIGGWGVQKINK